MSHSDGRRAKSRYAFEESEDSYSFDGSQNNKNATEKVDNFSSLYETRERFISFSNELGDHKHTEIREDILYHVEQNNKRERIYEAYMSEDMIIKIINLRIEKMIKNKRIKKNWSEEDVQILIWVVSKYSDSKHYDDIEKNLDAEDWQMIASLIPGVTPDSCMFKWLSLKKVNLATNNWSEEESILLGNLVKEKGFEGKNKDAKDWKLISQKLYFLNKRSDKIFRNAKQCRQHWNCYLNPNLKKGPWKPEEDIQLLKCIKNNKGSKKWSQIVRFFDGRTENALKNRYTLIIDKQKKHNKHKSELELIENYLDKCYVDQFTTEIPQEESEENSVHSEGISLDHVFKKEQNYINQNLKASNQIKRQPSLTNQIDNMHINNQDDQINSYLEQDAPITPVKIQKIKFQNFFSQKFSSFCFDKVQIGQMQPGVLNNGIFEKNIEMDTDKTYSPESPIKFKLKRFSSNFF